MAGTVGLMQCAEHDVGSAGTPSATMLAFDKVLSGEMNYDGGAPEHTTGTGGQDSQHRGMVTPIGSAETEVQTHTLLACLKPASIGALPTCIAEIQGGEVANADASRKQADCYVSEVKLGCAMGGTLRCAYGWMGLSEADVVISAKAAKQTNSVVKWHAGSALLSGLAYKMQSFEATAKTGITPQSSLDDKDDDNRFPEWFDPGDFEVNISLQLRVEPGIDLRAANPSTVTFAWTGVDTEGAPKTFTLDLTGGSGLEVTSHPLPIVAGKDVVIWRVDAQADHNDLAGWVTTFAA